jgi:hypothetical protein
MRIESRQSAKEFVPIELYLHIEREDELNALYEIFKWAVHKNTTQRDICTKIVAHFYNYNYR